MSNDSSAGRPGPQDGFPPEYGGTTQPTPPWQQAPPEPPVYPPVPGQPQAPYASMVPAQQQSPQHQVPPTHVPPVHPYIPQQAPPPDAYQPQIYRPGQPEQHLPPQPMPQAYSPQPVSGQPAEAMPQAYLPQPVSGQPTQPVSGQPVSGHPVSGQPGHAQPVVGFPPTESATPTQWPDQQSQPRQAWSDPAPIEADQPWQPRITPSPPRRGRLWLGILIGVLAGLLVFGTAGYFTGNYLASPDPDPTPTAAAPRPTGSMGAYEAGQLELNRKRFTGELAVIAEPWLAWVGGCARSGEPFGPKLDAGEQVRVFCEYNNVSVFFIEYKTVADRDAKRAARQRQNTDAKALTPGAADPSKKTGTSGKTTGTYIEYAYRMGTGDQARTTSGIWWEQDSAPVAAFIEVVWTDGIGEKWDSLRDVWLRYS